MATGKPPVSEDIRKTFSNVYRTPPESVAQAPGRVNLIGEHTDYNGGWVLPAPLPKYARVAVAPRPDRVVHVVSSNMAGAAATRQFDLDTAKVTGAWSDYLMGMCQAFAQRSCAVSGMNVCVASDVPLGSGLSSSAALNVAFGRAVRELFGAPVSDTDLAHMAQQSEHFVGAKVGMMDPMVISVGEMGHLLMLNTATLEHKSLAWPSRLELVVVHSGVHHAHAAGEYNARRASCEQAAEMLHVKDLCRLTEAHMSQVMMLESELLQRRARHVVLENARVAQTVQALRNNDDAALRRLLYASHVSLRDDYEVSAPALDALVEAAMANTACLGARMTGGGFGGCMIMVSTVGAGAALAADVLQRCRTTALRAAVVFCGSLERG